MVLNAVLQLQTLLSKFIHHAMVLFQTLRFNFGQYCLTFYVGIQLWTLVSDFKSNDYRLVLKVASNSSHLCLNLDIGVRF